MKNHTIAVIAALALAGAFTASAVSHKDFGRLVSPDEIEYAPVALDFCIVRTNVEEVVTEVVQEAEAEEETPTARDGEGEDGVAVSETGSETNATEEAASPANAEAETAEAAGADEEARPGEPTEPDIPAEPVVTYVTNLVTTVKTNYVSLGESVLTAKAYLSRGWKRIVDEKPSPSATNKVVVANGWAEDETTITRQYAEEDAPEPVKVPRKFSKLKIYGAISKLGAWEKVQAWLEGKTVDGVNGWMAFQLAQEVSEDNALFSAWAEEARQLLGLTQEQFDAMLSDCIFDESSTTKIRLSSRYRRSVK